MRKILQATVVGALAVGVAACDLEPNAGTLIGSRSSAPLDYERDVVLTQRVEKALGLNVAGYAYPVNTVVSNGTVLLWGTAETESERRRFELLAAGVVGVRAVDNRILVVHPSM